MNFGENVPLLYTSFTVKVPTLSVAQTALVFDIGASQMCQSLSLSSSQVYALTSEASEEEIEQFYQQLQEVLSGIPRKNI